MSPILQASKSSLNGSGVKLFGTESLLTEKVGRRVAIVSRTPETKMSSKRSESHNSYSPNLVLSSFPSSPDLLFFLGRSSRNKRLIRMGNHLLIDRMTTKNTKRKNNNKSYELKTKHKKEVLKNSCNTATESHKTVD